MLLFSTLNEGEGGRGGVGLDQKVRKLITRKVFTDRFVEENTQLELDK